MSGEAAERERVGVRESARKGGRKASPQSLSLRNSRWNESIEARDSLLRCLSMALPVPLFLKVGSIFRATFVEAKRKRVNARIRWPVLLS